MINQNRLEVLKTSIISHLIFYQTIKMKWQKKFGANGLVVPKRMTFVIDGNSKIEKIYKKVNINTHAKTILEEILK